MTNQQKTEYEVVREKICKIIEKYPEVGLIPIVPNDPYVYKQQYKEHIKPYAEAYRKAINNRRK